MTWFMKLVCRQRSEAVRTDPWRVLVTLERCPFTLLTFTALVVAGIYGQTHVGLLDPDVHEQMGYYGCLGLAVAGLSAGKRNRIVTAIVLLLLLRLTWSTTHIPEQGRMMSADLAHLVAFPLGLLLYQVHRLGATHQG